MDTEGSVPRRFNPALPLDRHAPKTADEWSARICHPPKTPECSYLRRRWHDA